MKKSAAGNRARIEAARFLEGEPEGDRRVNPGAVPVTPGIVVQVNVNTPRDPDLISDEIIEITPTQVDALPSAKYGAE